MFYARDFEIEREESGEPLSIFDRHHQTPSTEILRYKVKVAPDEGGHCRCEECWCEDSYSLSTKPDESKSPAETHVDWSEQAYVYAPSLYLDRGELVVVAKQFRLFESLPVRNPYWQTNAHALEYSPKVVQRRFPTKLLLGWRSPWKQVYEPGDELLWPHVGNKHQFLYEGRWQEDDRLVVAKRSIRPTAPPSDAIHSEGNDSNRTRWQRAIIDTHFLSELSDRPSYAEIAASPSGTLLVVYEKGSSDNTNNPEGNVLYWANSEDGTTWSLPAPLVAEGQPLVGYMPQVAINALGEIAVLFFQPSQIHVRLDATGHEQPLGVLRLARSLDKGRSWSVETLNEDRPEATPVPAKPLHFVVRTKDPVSPEPSVAYADTYHGRPQVLAQDELFFVSFLAQGEPGQSGDRVAIARASRDHSTAMIQTRTGASVMTEGTPITVSLERVNKHHMRVSGEPVSFMFSPNEILFPGARPHSPADESMVRIDFVNGKAVATVTASEGPPQASGARTDTSEGTPVSVGTAGVFGDTQGAHEDAQLASVPSSERTSWFGSGEFGGAALAWTSSEDRVPLARLVPLAAGDGRLVQSIEGNVDGNHQKAIMLRESLLRSARIEQNSGLASTYGARFPPKKKDGAFQVEYRQNPDGHENSPTESAQDLKHLASFERVWVYTLGIALAQFSRTRHVPGLSTAEHYARTQAFARYLCSRAVVDSADATKIKGWPFSWNTLDDDWKDARLVTGANAWAIHGIGSFIVSDAFRTLEDTEEQAWFRGCYGAALQGLADHRRRFTSENGHTLSLMTAGWTTQGLELADKPSQLLETSGQPVTENAEERWAYYSILDTIGYDAYGDPSEVKVCTMGEACLLKATADQAWRNTEISEKTWAALKEPVKASNVVTEHNLDVLSVLNHALSHAEPLGLTKVDEIQVWRDELRDGIFLGLWDEATSDILEETLKSGGPESPGSPKLDARKQQWIESALRAPASSPMGRVVTGGQFEADGSFVQSPHTAIDNCSWLALAVNYSVLEVSAGGAEGASPARRSETEASFQAQDPGSPSIYVDRLGQCLRYTVVRFTKKLAFGGPGSAYYGTHYFQNTFRDPYINPSKLQETSYHLEATMGLILGLHRFVEAYPEAPHADALKDESIRLWAGAQAFVRDHGFPYSSERIQDLSTRLASSTAVIWFVDVHDALQGRAQDLDRPLLDYAQDIKPLALVEAAHDSQAKLDRTDRGADPADRVLSGRSIDDVPYTFVEEQAWAIVSRLNRSGRARNRDDDPTIRRWLRGLLEVRIGGSQSEGKKIDGPEVLFPTVVHADTGEPLVGDYDTATQMWVYYALARALVHLQNQDDGLVEEIRNVLKMGLGGMLSQPPSSASGLLAGLFPHEMAPGAPEEAKGTALSFDNAAAFFALTQAAEALSQDRQEPPVGTQVNIEVPTHGADEIFAQRLMEHLAILEPRVVELCGNGGAPLYSISERDGPQAVEHTPRSRKIYALCSLFASYTGRWEAQQSLLAGLSNLPDHSMELISRNRARVFAKTEEPSSDRRGPVPEVVGTKDAWAAYGLPILARRGAKNFDPRQESLALFELMKLHRQAPDALPRHLAYTLAYAPMGVLGVASGPMVLEARSYGLHAQGPIDPEAFEHQIQNRIQDTIFALLASEFQPYRFDTLFKEILRLRFLRQTRPLDASDWDDLPSRFLRTHYPDLIEETSYALTHLCTMPPEVALVETAVLEAYLGMPCTLAETTLRALLTKRQGSDEDALNTLLSYRKQEEVWALTRTIETIFRNLGSNKLERQEVLALGEVGAHFADTTSVDLLLQAEPLSLRNDAGPLEVQEGLRFRFQDALKKRLEAMLGEPLAPKPRVVFEQRGIDPIEVFHTESPQYWKRASLEVRVLQDHADHPGVEWRQNGRPASASQFLLTTNQIQRARALRQLINAQAEGHLPRFAESANLNPATVHNSLRTGVVTRDHFEQLAKAQSLDAIESKNWARELNLVDAPQEEPASVQIPAFPGAPFLLGGLQTQPLFDPRMLFSGMTEGALNPGPESALGVTMGLQFAKEFGARELLRLALVEIAATGVFTAVTGEIHQEEIDALVDQIFADENHNVVVVEQGADFQVPSDFRYIGFTPSVGEPDPSDYYTLPREFLAQNPPHWEQALSLGIIANLGFGIDDAHQEQALAAEALRENAHGRFPRDVILVHTTDGIELFQRWGLNLSWDTFWQSPRGVVLYIHADQRPPSLVHSQPGVWNNWYSKEITSQDIPEAHRAAYVHWLHQWLLDTLLGQPRCKTVRFSQEECARSPVSWNDWRHQVKNLMASGANGPEGSDPLSGTRGPPPENPSENKTDSLESLKSSAHQISNSLGDFPLPEDQKKALSTRFGFDGQIRIAANSLTDGELREARSLFFARPDDIPADLIQVYSPRQQTFFVFPAALHDYWALIDTRGALVLGLTQLPDMFEEASMVSGLHQRVDQTFIPVLLHDEVAMGDKFGEVHDGLGIKLRSDPLEEYLAFEETYAHEQFLAVKAKLGEVERSSLLYLSDVPLSDGDLVARANAQPKGQAAVQLYFETKSKLHPGIYVVFAIDRLPPNKSQLGPRNLIAMSGSEDPLEEEANTLQLIDDYGIWRLRVPQKNGSVRIYNPLLESISGRFVWSDKPLDDLEELELHDPFQHPGPGSKPGQGETAESKSMAAALDAFYASILVKNSRPDHPLKLRGVIVKNTLGVVPEIEIPDLELLAPGTHRGTTVLNLKSFHALEDWGYHVLMAHLKSIGAPLNDPVYALQGEHYEATDGTDIVSSAHMNISDGNARFEIEWSIEFTPKNYGRSLERTSGTSDFTDPSSATADRLDRVGTALQTIFSELQHAHSSLSAIQEEGHSGKLRAILHKLIARTARPTTALSAFMSASHSTKLHESALSDDLFQIIRGLGILLNGKKELDHRSPPQTARFVGEKLLKMLASMMEWTEDGLKNFEAYRSSL